MKKHLAQYSKALVPIARVLRKQMTDTERKLWSLLRGNQLGVKFRRQVPFDRYVVDFYCDKAKLIIELDGNQHYTENGIHEGVVRDEYLQEMGCSVIRYPNYEIFENENGVMQDIYEHVKARTTQPSDPL